MSVYAGKSKDRLVIPRASTSELMPRNSNDKGDRGAECTRSILT
jgi:hypothetical protein